MTPSDLICDATGRGLPATSTVVTAAAHFNWAEVPSIMTSDLSAFNCRWFSRNHCLTALEQRASRSSADVVLAASMTTNIITMECDRKPYPSFQNSRPTVLNDLEWPLTRIQRCYSTSNDSKTIQESGGICARKCPCLMRPSHTNRIIRAFRMLRMSPAVEDRTLFRQQGETASRTPRT